MKKLYILKTGSTYPAIKKQHGDFEDWILEGLNRSKEQVMVRDAQINSHPPSFETCAGIVITGSHSMVTDSSDWINRVIQWLPDAVELKIPILGICFGHQLLAQAMGGKVKYNPGGREMGVNTIKKFSTANDDLLFKTFPEQIEVLESHRQSVIELPTSAKVLYYNDHDQNQAYVINNSTWGIQFHPEFNESIMKAYIYHQKEELEKEGFSLTKLIKDLNHFNRNQNILTRFLEIVENEIIYQ
ncbi:glutamine amidotransferase [Calditrichota bacterium]